MWVWFLSQKVTLGEVMATHSSILACRIPWTEETGRLQSTGYEEWDMTEVTQHAHNNLFISVWIYGNVYHTLDDKIIYFIFLPKSFPLQTLETLSVDYPKCLFFQTFFQIFEIILKYFEKVSNISLFFQIFFKHMQYILSFLFLTSPLRVLFY